MKKITKILLVSSAFHPEISPRSHRATELAMEFARQGHEVTVISKYREFNYSKYFADLRIVFKMWGKPILKPISEPKFQPLAFIGRVISRLLTLLFEYPNIEEMFRVKAKLKKERGYDLMISFAVPYPVHWGVAWSRSKHNRIAGVWIADCGDPYMGDVLDTFRHPFYFGYLEKWFCKKADYISIPVESAKEGYYKEFHDKLRIIPQGFNFLLNNDEIMQKQNEVPRFAYAGKFLAGIRDPTLLLNFLLEIKLSFKFYVFTDQPEIFEEYLEILKDKLVISDFIPREELIEKLAGMDFLINFDNNTSLNVPSKLIDYSITKRPVLNIDRNFSFPQLQSFLKGNYDGRMQLPGPQTYHINRIAKLFLTLLSQNS